MLMRGSTERNEEAIVHRKEQEDRQVEFRPLKTCFTVRDEGDQPRATDDR